MNELAKHIEYLLLKRNSVIVPSLGIFHAAYVPSRWIGGENLFVPPVRSVHFNPAIVSDPEEVFIQSLSETFGMSAADALSRCETMVADFHKALITEGSVDFGSLGVFTIEDDAMLSMASCECGVITPNLYGLDVLQFSPLDSSISTVLPHSITVSHVDETSQQQSTAEDVTTPSETMQEVVIARQESEHITFRIRRNVIHYTMALVASVLLFFVLRPTSTLHTSTDRQQQAAIPVFLQPNMVHQSGETIFDELEDIQTIEDVQSDYDAVLIDVTDEALNEGVELQSINTPEQIAAPATKTTATTNNAATTNNTTTSNTATSKATPSTTTTKTTAAAKPAATTTASKPSSANAAPHYVVVLASAVSRPNADSFVKKLAGQGIAAKIVEGKMRRIIVDKNFTEEREAYSYINQLNSEHNNEFSNLWVLKM